MLVLAAEAARLEAAERCGVAHRAVRVDADRPGSPSRSTTAQRASTVAGPHRTGGPKSLSLQMRIAPASSSNGMTTATGSEDPAAADRCVRIGQQRRSSPGARSRRPPRSAAGVDGVEAIGEPPHAHRGAVLE